MKAGIITFHAPYNCGAFLQAYALQTYLEEACHVEAEILNYQTNRQKNLLRTYRPWRSPVDCLKNLFTYSHHRSLQSREMHYKDCQNQYLHLTVSLMDEASFVGMCQGYDLLISGSDQIWNTSINGFAEGGQGPYFFDGCDKPRISYAPSLGPHITPAVREGLKDHLDSLRSYSHISTREEASASLLEELTGCEVTAVVDPTLLLNAEDYLNIADNRITPHEPYVFLYSVNYSKEALDMALSISTRLKLPVVTFYTGHRSVLCIRNHIRILYDNDPRCFIDVLQNASYVITDSYHGTVFSILFRRPFACPKQADAPVDERLMALLESADLASRYIYPEEMATLTADNCLDPLVISPTLAQKIAAAKEWLQLAVH